MKAPRVIAHALEDAGEVDEVASHGILVAAFTVDGKRVFRERQRLRVAAFVPAEQPDAAQDVALEARALQLAADPKRGAQRAIGGVEPLQQRQKIALAQVRLRQPRGRAAGRQVRSQPAG